MTRKIFALFAALLMAFTFGASQIQAAAPVAEISIGSYETLSGNIETLAKMVDNDQLAVVPKLLETQLGDNLKSFDKTKPSGVLIFLKEKDGNVEGASFLAFVPLADSTVLFEFLEDNDAVEVEATTVKDVEMKKVTFQEKTVYVVTANGWTFVSDKTSLLLDLPKDPAAALGDLPSKYLLAAKLNVDVVPDSVKKWVEDQIEEGIKAAQAANLEDEEEEEAPKDGSFFEEAQKITQIEQLKEFKKMLYEFKTVVIGTVFDSKKEVLRIDLDITPVENTEFAKMLSAYKGQQGLGNVILDDATGYLTEVEILEESKAGTSIKVLNLYRDGILKALSDSKDVKCDKEKINALIKKTSSAIENIIKDNAGKAVKTGLAFFVKTDDIGFVSVTQGVDTTEIDQLIKDWIKETVPKADNYFKAGAETWKGLTFNVATIPTEKIVKELQKAAEKNENDAEKINEVIKTIQAIYGDKIEIAYATGDKVFYLAASKDAVALIKRTADNVDATIPNGDMDYFMIDVKDVLNTFSKFTFIDEEIRDILDAVASSASDNTGKFSASANLTDKGGVIFHLEADGGILKMIQTGIMLYSMNSGMGGFDGDEEFEFDLEDNDEDE